MGATVVLKRSALLGVIVAAVTAMAPAAVAMPPHGLDVSSHQHPSGRAINWSAVQTDGHSFMFVKATEGRTYTNPYFQSDWDAAGSLGMARGAYDYARPTTAPSSAVNEANHFLAVTGPMKVSRALPAVLDLENAGPAGHPLTPSQLIAWTQSWLNRVKHVTGRKPIIYTYPYFWQHQMRDTRQFTSYPLWIAGYTYGGGPGHLIGGWKTWAFWQYGVLSCGVAGVGKDVDVDVANGPLKQYTWGHATARSAPQPARPVLCGGGSAGGSRGPAVSRLQRELNGAPGGDDVDVDGVFGPATLAAVKDFQRTHHLTVDGVVGPATWGALDAAQADPPPKKPPPKKPPPKLTYRRLSGHDRVRTAVAVSHATYKSASTVVVARADLYPDALAAGPLAAKLHAPLLLSPPKASSTALTKEVHRLGAHTAYVIGDQSALSTKVDAGLRGAGVRTIHRIGGHDRFDTAALIAQKVGGKHVYVARGSGEQGWVDAAAVSGLAAYTHRPLLLTRPGRLPGATSTELSRLGASAATIVGGHAAVSSHVEKQLQAHGRSVDRLSGTNRYKTSTAVADAAVKKGMHAGTEWLATGEAFPDALSAGPAVAKDSAVLLLVKPHHLAAAGPWLSKHPGSRKLTVVGGKSAVAEAVAKAALQR
jgi:lysozyme